MRELWPPITVIERKVLGYGNEPGAPINNVETGLPFEKPATTTAQAVVPEMPAAIRDVIQRRVAAQAVVFALPPKQGQIVLIKRRTITDEEPDSEAQESFGVLLVRSGYESGVWEGLLVAPETDYATCWDLLLEPEDEPFDPAAGMVQVWNPVQVQVPEDAVVLAELKPDRMETVQLLASEFAQGLPPEKTRSQPGWIGVRQVDGYSVLTGTPLGGESDPRRDYQRLYEQAAAMICVPAQDGGSDLHGEAVLTRIMWNIEQWADGIGLALPQVAPIAQPLGEKITETGASYHLQGQAELKLLQHGEEKTLQIHAVLIGQGPVILTLMRGREMLQQHELTPENNEADLFLDYRESHVVGLKLPDTDETFTIPLN